MLQKQLTVLVDATTEQLPTLKSLERGLRELEAANTLSSITDVHNRAEVIRDYAKRAKLGLHVQNMAAELRLRAERKAGRILCQLNLRGGDRKSKSSDSTLKLDDLGISKYQSARWQLESTVSESDFSAFLREARESDRELSSAELVRYAKRTRRVTAKPMYRQSRRARVTSQTVSILASRLRTLENLVAPLIESGDVLPFERKQRRELKQIMRELLEIAQDLQCEVEQASTSR